MVADNSVALIGGRNIGNEYFQIDPELQVAEIATGEPYAGMVSARLLLVWARAHVVSDSAD